MSLGKSAPGVAFVAPDNNGGGYQAAVHLVTTGRRRIGAVDGSALAEAADLSSVYMPIEDEAASAVHHLLDPALPAPGRLSTKLRVRGSS